MSLVYLSLAIAALWINLLGVGLAARRLVGDYVLARVAGVLVVCLVCFFLEHFVGFGVRPPVLPFTTAVSLWLIWRNRSVVRAHVGLEAVFLAGFFYCLAWRYAFPDIDWSEDKMPNYGLIVSYMRGTRLPPPDLWLANFPANCYYSFQHYGAALMGRILCIGPGLSYHLAFCTLVGFFTLLAGSCASRLCAWKPGRWVVIVSLLIGGSGVAAAAHFLIKNPYPVDEVRFVGGAIVHDELTPLGHRVSSLMVTPGKDPRDLPMEPLSFFLSKGDYHPPLAGFVLLALAAALIAAQETGAEGRARVVNHALLAATLPVAFISNTWIVPLQLLLVGGWFIYRVARGEHDCVLPAFMGALVATALEYPFLIEFTQQAIGDNAAIRFTAAEDLTPLLGWLLTFWPVLGIMLLGLLERERRPLALFFTVIWAVALIASEFLYNHDIYGGPWARFNSTLKWWQWVFAAIVLTQGSMNLGSRSRVARYGTLLLLLPCLSFAYDLGRQYVEVKKESLGRLSGSAWIERDRVVEDMIKDLSSRPDGVTLESGLIMANTESPAVTLFSGKQSLLGWPWLEGAWRGSFLDIDQRLTQMNEFYAGALTDSLRWLLHNNVRYILWLPRDNVDKNSRFLPINEKIRSRYYWHHCYGNDRDFAIGYWERIDPTPGG
jgi:uncharacterized membrane protein